MQYSVGSVFDAKIVSPGTISCVKVFDCTEATSRDRLCADNFPSIFYFHNFSLARVSDTSLASTTVASTSGQKHGSRLVSFSVSPQMARMPVPFHSCRRRVTNARSLALRCTSSIRAQSLHCFFTQGIRFFVFIFVFVTVFCILTCAATYCSGCKLLSSDELGNINEWYVGLSCARMAFSRISHEL